MTKKNVLIYIASAQKGLFFTFAQKLSEKHNVNIIVSSEGVKKCVLKTIPELAEKTFIESDYQPVVEEESIIEECRKREEKYGELFSMIISQDRALGKGYLFNADRHPDVLRAWWDHKSKLREALREFLWAEHIMEKYAPDVILGMFWNKTRSLVAQHHNVLALGILQAKLGNRQFWRDNLYLTSEPLISEIKACVAKVKEDKKYSEEARQYKQESASAYVHKRIDFTYKGAIKKALSLSYNQLFQQIKGTRKKNSYRFLGWVPSVFRKPYMYDYFQKYGKTPSDLEGYKWAYFPLHLEPEIALMSASPEFYNSLEVITWVSKSLPADTLLVIKEHPHSFAVRSKDYYGHLRKIGNVVLADPRVASWEWGKSAEVIVSITGTVGVEGVYFGKPVLSFGKHQMINHLPSVKYVNNYESTRSALEDVLKWETNDERFEIAREAIYRAQTKISFELPNYIHIHKSIELQEEEANIALAKLSELYPGII